MNRKTFYILSLLLGSFAAPSILSAQNLLLDNGFESGTLVNGPALYSQIARGTPAYGVWSGVIGQYGWTLVEVGTNKVLSACGKGLPPGTVMYDGKRIFQAISEKSVLPGTYTLKFKCQCDPNLLSAGHMTVAVAQRTEGSAEIVFHIEKADQKNPKGYNILFEKPLLTRQQSEITAPGQWRTVEANFEVPVGGKPLLVMFYGMVDTGSFRVDDISLTRKGGSPVPPEKSVVDDRNIVKPLQKSVAAPVVAVAPKPAPVTTPVAAAPQSAPVVKPASIPVPIAKPVVTPAPVVAAAPQPAPVAKPVSVPVPVIVSTPAPEPVTASVSAPAIVRPVPEPVRPPVENLILSGDFSSASLALPTTTGDTTAELSGRWLRSTVSPWEISPYGGNLGAYARAAASRNAARLLYVVSDAKRSTGSYLLRLDYILSDPSDVLGVKVFVSDRDITIGTDGGVLKMNDTKNLPDMIMLPSSPSWSTYYVPVELGSGYNYIYVLFTGSGAGNTGLDNISLSPKRR